MEVLIAMGAELHLMIERIRKERARIQFIERGRSNAEWRVGLVRPRARWVQEELSPPLCDSGGVIKTRPGAF